MSEKEIDAKLDSIVEINRDIRQWLRMLAWDQAAAVVEEAVGDNNENKILYERLDSETSIGEIIEDISMSRRTAFTRLNEWQRVGIVKKVDRGKYDTVASLDSLGIPSPETDG